MGPVKNKAFLILLTLLFISCGLKPKSQPVSFPVQGQVFTVLGREAAEGLLDFSKHARFEYQFAAAPVIVPPASFEIEYTLAGEGVVLEVGGKLWALPGEAGCIMHYAVPIEAISSFAVFLNNKDAVNSMRIYSVKFTERWYGFFNVQDEAVNHIYASPFISRRPGESAAESSWTVDPPADLHIPAGFFPTASIVPQSGAISVDTGSLRFQALPQLRRLNIPAGMIAAGKPLVISGDPASFRLSYTVIPSFPLPVTADPGMVLAWPVENWRDPRYEVFKWESFPSLLIFDTANYEVQDRMLKRLAFFVEKAGFRGRLAPDREIAELHGWNAHDYRADDLALFFQAARDAGFPLLAEERELERSLFSAGIIRESGAGITGGEGGIISISRESPDYLRYRFMAHEGFHGLFFIDEDFRAFSRRRWQQFPAQAKRFTVSFFNFQRYDTADEYLLINEFMAHVLQQPVSQAGYYFGQALPLRLEDSWRRADLPEKDQSSGSWPVLAAAFTREAEAFSAYVNSRWGLAAGRVHLVTVRQP